MDILYDGGIMTNLKIDYNIIYSEVKVYEKKYKRKDKTGKQVDAKTIQNTILLPKKIPFKSNESVVIMKEKTFKDLTKDSNFNTSDLKQQLKDKNKKIEELKNQLGDQLTKEDNFNNTINNIVEDLRVANHRNQEIQQQMQEMAIELARYDEKLKQNKDLFNIMNSYYEKLLKEAINTSVDATIVEINKELKETNFIQRLKGLKIVIPPTIDTDKIIKDNMEELDAMIDVNQLLE